VNQTVAMGRKEVYEVVKDIIERRTDGRAPSADPINAFAAKLAELGQVRFQVWWARTVSELNRTNHPQMPMVTCVLAAALSEAALAFVVNRARSLGTPTMSSKTFDDPPTRWKFEDLLRSAAAGGPDAIFDQKTRDRAENLNLIRQRIHVGRLMAGAGPIPDSRPEEASEAIETMHTILRLILDWLDRHPAPKS
jgi:hypothetical protein